MLFITVLFTVGKMLEICTHHWVHILCYMDTISLWIHLKMSFLKEHKNILEGIVKYSRQGPE